MAIDSIAITSNNDSLAVLVRGWGLSRRLDATYSSAGAAAPVSIPLCADTDSTLKASIPLVNASQHGVIGLIDDGGRRAAHELVVASLAPPLHISAIVSTQCTVEEVTQAIATLPGVTIVNTPSTGSGHPTPINTSEEPHVLYGYEPLDNQLHIIPDATADVTSLLASISQLPCVEMADITAGSPRLDSTPNDARYIEQWGLHETAGAPHTFVLPDITITPGASISADTDSLWDCPPLNEDILWLGILDSGIDRSNTDTRFDLRYSEYDQDFSGYNSWMNPDGVDAGGHGTAVAGIAAAATNNLKGMAGAAGERVHTVSARYLSNRYTQDAAPGWVAVRNALIYLESQVPNLRVINMSFGGTIGGQYEPGQVGPGQISMTEYRQVGQALKACFLSGKMLVASMGNYIDSTAHYPAAYSDYVFAVGATSWHDSIWTDASLSGWVPDGDIVGSARGHYIDVVAPGGRGVAALAAGNPIGSQVLMWSIEGPTINSPSPYNPETWAFGGTSASSALVAGLGAALMQAKPSLTAEDVQQVLQRTARDMGPAGFDNTYGHGKIDARLAARFVSAPNRLLHCRVGADGQSALAIVDSTIQVNLHLDFPPAPLTSGDYSATRYHLRGTADLTAAAFAGEPQVWVRRSTTRGMPAVQTWDDDLNAMWGGLAYQWTSNVVECDTYVYRIGTRWYPVPPDSARVDITAIGQSNLFLAVQSVPPSPASLQVTVHSERGRHKIAFSGATSGPLSIRVFDIGGRMVRTLVDGLAPSGLAEVEWDGRDEGGRVLAPGVFFCKAQQAGESASAKVLILR